MLLADNNLGLCIEAECVVCLCMANLDYIICLQILVEVYSG